MEFLFEHPISEQSIPNSDQSSVGNEQSNGSLVATTESESFSSTLEALESDLRSVKESRDDAVDSRDAEEEKMLAAQLEFLKAAADSEANTRAEKTERLRAEIKALSQVVSGQIDRLEQAKARLAILEELRVHAETKVCERAEREIRLEAEIEALRHIEAGQDQRIEAAEAELRRLTEEQSRAQAAAEAHRIAESEARRLAASEAARQVADEARRLAEEEDRELEHLETIRARAEAAALERAQKESLLNSQLLAFSEAAAKQLKRIETAEADLARAEEELRRFEEEARQRTEQLAIRLAETEARRESTAQELARAEAEAQVILKEEAEQLNPIADPEVAIQERNEELQVAAESVGQEEVEPQFQPWLASTVVDVVAPAKPVNSASQETLQLSWLADRLRSGGPEEYADAKEELARLDDNAAFALITALFDDGSDEVRNGAARALYDLSSERADVFTRALREASPERRQQIVMAIEASGLAADAIDNLAGESREKTHDAFSLLFLMAKAGEVQSLFLAIENHPNVQVRLSVIKLLTFVNRPDIIPPLRSLAVRGALPIEVRSALMKSIYEMNSAIRERSQSAA